MPAEGFSSGKRQFPAGRYIAHVVEVKEVIVPDFNDKEKKIKKFKWDIDVQQGDGTWERISIFSGRRFADPSRPPSSPQFVPMLNRLVRACGVPLPTTEAEVMAWHENQMAGLRFGIVVTADEESGALTEKYVPLRAAAQEAPAAAPTPVQKFQPVAPPPPPASPVDTDEDLWGQQAAA